MTKDEMIERLERAAKLGRIEHYEDMIAVLAALREPDERDEALRMAKAALESHEAAWGNRCPSYKIERCKFCAALAAIRKARHEV